MEKVKVFYTVREIANCGLLSEYGLRRMLKSAHKPPHIMSGNRVLFNRAQLEQWLAAECRRNEGSNDVGKAY